MEFLQVFFIAVLFSILGSIPPGTINLSVLQLGVEKKITTALRFALAAALVEYPYTWIAIQFEDWISSSPLVIENFQLIAAVVMTVLGLLNLWSARKPTEFIQRFNESGFRRGLLLSILNPLAIPYWIAITAYLKARDWIDLSTPARLHSYIFGTVVGAFILLASFALLAEKLSPLIKQSRAVKYIPGATLVALGLYAFARYILS